MKRYLLGLFDDEEVLLNAVDKVRASNMKIHDVVTPFAVHGLDERMGLRESKLHIGGFWIGLTGATIAFSFMTWVFTANWPIVFGGKPHFSFPAFIPIMFEFTGVVCLNRNDGCVSCTLPSLARKVSRAT
jgi:hypothetical protein